MALILPLTASAGGGSYDFNGTTNSLDLGNISGVDGATKLTATAWINVDTCQGDIIDKSNGTDSLIFSMTCRSGNFIRFNGTGTTSDTAASTIVNGRWTHVAIVFDGGGTGNDGRVQIYINGILMALTHVGTVGTTLTTNAAVAVKVGQNDRDGGATDDDSFDGKISHAMLWTGVALSQKQVQELMWRPGLFRSGMKFYLPLMQDTKDWSGNNTTVTAEDAPTSSTSGSPIHNIAI